MRTRRPVVLPVRAGDVGWRRPGDGRVRGPLQALPRQIGSPPRRWRGTRQQAAPALTGPTPRPAQIDAAGKHTNRRDMPTTGRSPTAGRNRWQRSGVVHDHEARARARGVRSSITMSSPNIRLAGLARPRVGRHVGAFVALATAVLILTGCDLPWSSAPTAEAPEIRPSELTDAGGQPCPQVLPLGDDPLVTASAPRKLQTKSRPFSSRRKHGFASTTPSTSAGPVAVAPPTVGVAPPRPSPSLRVTCPLSRLPWTTWRPLTAAAHVPPTSAPLGWSCMSTTAT